jgi:hypothetical protein
MSAPIKHWRTTKKLHLRKPIRNGTSMWTVCGLRVPDYKYCNTVQDFLVHIDPLYSKYFVKCKRCARHTDVGMELLRREANRRI